MWINKRQMADIVGEDKTRVILSSVYSPYTKKLFSKKVVPVYVQEYHWKADRMITARKDMTYIDLKVAIRAYKHLYEKGNIKYRLIYKDKLQALELINRSIRRNNGRTSN